MTDQRPSHRNQLIEAAASAIRSRWDGEPLAGIILGSGLGNLGDHIDAEATVDYRDIPHFRRSTALAHKGQLICGRLGGTSVLTMSGRCHLYEGYTVDEIALPVQVMARLGAELLIVSNASGGVNPKFAAGEIMVLEDHVNMMWGSPLGSVETETTLRFPRLASTPYDAELIGTALSIARRENFVAHRGIYVAVTGPSYETRAEYRFFRGIGDAVGMSTVPEVIAAAQCGMRVLALSVVTNVARPDAPELVDAEDVVDAAEMAEPNLRKIVTGTLTES